MTIKDIARESGYAVGTVSRVLNNSPNVSPATRDRILEVVRRHNFHPNANAKHLKQQQSYGIALLVKGTNNMLFAGLVEKMQAAIEARGYLSSIYYIDEESNEVAQAMMICQTRKPYGIVFLGSDARHFDAAFGALGVPCILATNSASALNLPNLSSVSVDDVAAAGVLIDHLYAHGHRRIGVIGGRPELSLPSRLRLAGYQSAMMRYSLPFDRERQYACARFSMKSGYAAMEELLRKYPEMTAVVAMSDLMALGAMRALYDHGLSVPGSVSLTGYDGLPLSQYCIPRLTTISQNTDRLAQRSVEILLHCIEDGAEAVHESVPFALVEGESVGTARE